MARRSRGRIGRRSIRRGRSKVRRGRTKKNRNKLITLPRGGFRM